MRRAARMSVLACACVAALAPGLAQGAVRAPKVTNVSVPESATAVAKFTVTLPGPARGKTRVPYSTRDGSAKAGADYVRKAGRLVFKRGQRRKTISVRILGDALDEPNETFTMKISAVKRRLRAKSATGTIVDDDPAPLPPAAGGGTTDSGTAGGGTTGGGTTGGGTTGGSTPPPETCNGADDDQDGTVDDGVCTVTVTLAGPGSGTVTSNPAGISCPGTCSASFPGGVTLTAAPSGGSAFSGWSGDCSGTATCVLGAGERSVTASFNVAIQAGQLVINEINYDPSLTTGDANGDGVVDTTQDEFVEIVNPGTAAVDLQGSTVADGFGVRHTFGSTVVPAGCSVVVFGGGTPTGSFGGSQVVTASTGALQLNNTGDTITVRDANGTTVATETYPSANIDQSLTRSPDITGAFVQHTTANAALAFSPGTTLSGAAFSGCS